PKALIRKPRCPGRGGDPNLPGGRRRHVPGEAPRPHPRVRDRRPPHVWRRVDYAGGASKFPCTRCAATMATRPVGVVTGDVCTDCHGVWFDQDELEQTVRAVTGEVPLPGTGLRAEK